MMILIKHWLKIKNRILVVLNFFNLHYILQDSVLKMGMTRKYSNVFYVRVREPRANVFGTRSYVYFALAGKKKELPALSEQRG